MKNVKIVKMQTDKHKWELDAVAYENKMIEFQDMDLVVKEVMTVKSHDTKESLENSGVDMHIYKRRWYILGVFSMFAFTQSCFWNTWGPITTSSEIAFGWKDGTVAWMTNWGPVSYLLSGLIFPWILQVKGLRWAVVPSMLLVATGSIFRVISSETTSATVLIHIGQFLNGLAGPVAMGGVPSLSAVWFPPKERITATAIGANLGALGGALAFISGPGFVSVEPLVNGTCRNTNNSNVLPRNANETSELYSNETANISEEGKRQIMIYMYYECGWCCLIFLLILVYFPAKPPKSPSVSASADRESYWTGLWSLRKKLSYMLIAAVFGISTGVINCWGTVLAVNLRSYNINENEAGWIGFYSSVTGCVFSVIIGRFADLFARRVKLCITTLFILSAAFFLLFTLMLIGCIEFTRAMLYGTAIGGVTFLSGSVPLIYELGCELAYPTSEGAANGFLTLLNNVGGLIFLAVFSFPDVGSMWMNWTAVGAVAGCIPMIIILKGRFKRLEVDEMVDIGNVTNQEVQVNKE